MPDISKKTKKLNKSLVNNNPFNPAIANNKILENLLYFLRFKQEITNTNPFIRIRAIFEYVSNKRLIPSG